MGSRSAVPCSAAGITLSRSWLIRVLVAAASGEVAGVTLITEAPWPGMGAETAAIPGSVFRVAARRVNAAVAAGVLWCRPVAGGR